LVTQYALIDKMETWKEVLKRLRKERGFSQHELAQRSGLNETYIAKMETGRGPKSITLETARALAAGLGVSPEEFLRPMEQEQAILREAQAKYGHEAPESRSLKDYLRILGERFEVEETVRIWLRGSVPAGCPLPEEESHGEYFDLPVSYISGIQRPYALRISGESLVDMGISNGDVVIVDPDAEIIEGKTYVVRIGAECCVKRIHRQDDRLLLVGANGTIDIREPQQVETLGRVRMVFRPPREV